MLIARIIVRTYQLLVWPILTMLTGPGGRCRFEPSCSRYFLEAVEKHGLKKGGWLGVKRLMSCHPWGGSGYDPVCRDTDL